MKKLFTLLVALLVSVHAYALTPAQQEVVRLEIINDPVLSALPPSSDAINAIILAFQAPASPVCIVWKTRVTQDEIEQNGFDWVQVDNLTVGKARIWEWMFNNADRTINPSRLNVRQGVDEAWKGTAAMLAVRAAVYVHLKRPANWLEKLFATGACTDASPSTMSVEGQMNYEEVRQFMGW